MLNLSLLLKLVIGVGAIFLFFQDCKKQEISLILFIVQSISITIYSVLFLFNTLYSNWLAIAYNLLIAIIFLVILLVFLKQKKVAIADIIYLTLTILILGTTKGLISIMLASLIGILCGKILKDKHVGFVGLLALTTTILLFI